MTTKTSAWKILETPSGELSYSPELTADTMHGMLQYSVILRGTRRSTLAEEMAIIDGMRKNGIDPAYAIEYADLCKYSELLTGTVLVAPKGWDYVYETDVRGNKKYPRIVVQKGSAVALVRVPEGRGRVIVETHPDLGVPLETQEGGDGMPFEFRPDNKSVVVALRFLYGAGNKRVLAMDAWTEPSKMPLTNGMGVERTFAYREVSGPWPSYPEFHLQPVTLQRGSTRHVFERPEPVKIEGRGSHWSF